MKSIEELRTQQRLDGYKAEFKKWIESEKRPKDFTKESPHKGLKVGDIVTFTNDYGAEFGGLEVLGFSTNPLSGRDVFLNSDCYWMPKKATSLRKE